MKEITDHEEDTVRCWTVSQIRSSPPVVLQNKSASFSQFRRTKKQTNKRIINGVWIRTLRIELVLFDGNKRLWRKPDGPLAQPPDQEVAVSCSFSQINF